MIILLGYMGVGKSTVGKQLAASLKCQFIDLDNYIEQKENTSITSIFKQKGEIFFRKIESQYLKALLDSKEYEIIALGGGTPCYANNMDLIKTYQNSTFYLKMELNVLADRLYQIKDTRPLLSHIDDRGELKDFIRKHLFERQFYYMQANYTIDVSTLAIEEIVNNILNKLK